MGDERFLRLYAITVAVAIVVAVAVILTIAVILFPSLSFSAMCVSSLSKYDPGDTNHSMRSAIIAVGSMNGIILTLSEWPANMFSSVRCKFKVI